MRLAPQEDLAEALTFYISKSFDDFSVANTQNAKKQLASFLDEYLGSDNKYAFSDGKVLRRVQRESRTWTVEGLKEVGLDEDMVMTVSKVDMKLARAVVDEMIERGEHQRQSAVSMIRYS